MRTVLILFIITFITSIVVAGQTAILKLVPVGQTLELATKQEQKNAAGEHQAICENIQLQYSVPHFGFTPYHLCSAFFKNLTFIDTYHDSINAMSTIFIAAFTIVLAWKTAGLHVATKALQSLAAQQGEDMRRS